MDGINARLMIANRQSWGAKNKPVPVIFSALCLMEVGSELIRNPGGGKSVVNKQLNFNAGGRPRLINYPTSNGRSVSVIEDPAEIRVRGREEKCDGNGGDQKRFNN